MEVGGRRGEREERPGGVEKGKIRDGLPEIVGKVLLDDYIIIATSTCTCIAGTTIYMYMNMYMYKYTYAPAAFSVYLHHRYNNQCLHYLLLHAVMLTPRHCASRGCCQGSQNPPCLLCLLHHLK